MNIKDILVVEDDRVLTAFYKLLLTEWGYSCDLAHNGARAFEYLDHSDYRAMIIDIKLPDMNGIDVFRHSKSVRPNAKVIIVTAEMTPDIETEINELGAYTWLTKPFESILLKRHLESIGKTAVNKDGQAA